MRVGERWPTMAAFKQALFGHIGQAYSGELQATDAGFNRVAVDEEEHLVEVGRASGKSRWSRRLKISMLVVVCLLVLGTAAGWYMWPTLPKLKVGDYVQFGKYDNQSILWSVIHFEDENMPMLFSDKVLTVKEFDSSGKTTQILIQIGRILEVIFINIQTFASG